MAVMPAEAVKTFVTFGPPHVAVMALTAVAAVGLPAAARIAASAKLTRAIAWAIAGGIVLNELVYYACGLAIEPMEEFAREYLPVHVCGVAVYLTAAALVWRNQYVYEVAYFWALAGTVQAILTPELAEGYPSYWFFEYFIRHGGVVVGVLFATLALEMRPSPWSVVRVIAISNAYTAVVAAVNWLLGANYMFLCEPPDAESPFFFLPWPWYIVFLEFVGIGLILLLYLPFAVRDRRRPGEPAIDARR